MSRDHERRCCALQAMFQFDLGGTSDLVHLRESFESRAREARSANAFERECDFEVPIVEEGIALAKCAWATREEADQALALLTPEWSWHRQPTIDRNILRLGYYEIKHGGVPAAIAINEAIELSKEYSHSASPPFINGVLDRVANPTVSATTN